MHLMSNYTAPRTGVRTIAARYAIIG
jgi:hypothetical protein